MQQAETFNVRVQPNHFGLNVPFSHEIILTDLKLQLEKPVLFLPDRAGNIESILHPLELKGVIERRNREIRLGKNATDVEVVLGGDSNDRAPDYTEIVRLSKWLREHGVALTALAGNHDLFLQSIFLTGLPTELTYVSDFPQHLELGNLPDPRRVVDHWMREGGKATVLDLANTARVLFRSRIDQICHSKEGVDWFNTFVGEAALFHFERYRPLDQHLVMEDFCLARHLAKTPDYSGFINSLRPFWIKSGVFFVHAYPTPEFFSSQDLDLGALRAKFDSHRKDPASCFAMAFGISCRDLSQNQHSQEYQRWYGPFGDFLWKRIRADKIARSLGVNQVDSSMVREATMLSDEQIQAFTRRGFSAIVRGHDPPKVFLSSVQTCFSLSPNLSLVNAAGEQTSAHWTNHVYIERDGVVTSSSRN